MEIACAECIRSDVAPTFRCTPASNPMSVEAQNQEVRTTRDRSVQATALTRHTAASRRTPSEAI